MSKWGDAAVEGTAEYEANEKFIELVEQYTDGQVKIEMDHPQQIEPEQVGIHTGDYVEIQGIPPVNMVNTPEIEGGIGTMAMIMNCIPHVINPRPGLKTMVDIPVPHAIMGDMRDMIDEDCKLVK